MSDGQTCDGASASPVRALASALAHSTAWSTRVAAIHEAEHLPTRIGLKRALRRAFADATDRIVLALSGRIVDVNGEPALVTDNDWQAFPEDSTLELQWIRSELRDVEARMLIVVVDILGDETDAAQVFDLLDIGRPDRLLTIARRDAHTDVLWTTLAEALSEGSASTLESLSGALRGTSPTAHIAFHGDPHTPIEREGGLPPAPGDTDPLGDPDTTAPETGDSSALVGSTLPGRFRLTRELARGAHGVVYMARQLSVNRLVAVKVLDQGASTAKRYSATHFVDEIQTVGRLDHPNVIRIYQADRTPDGRLFYAMELVRGPTLETLMEQEGGISPERAVSLTRQVLSGLHAAHTAGVVHSDIKPSNVALQAPVGGGSQDERAVVFDFGVARLREDNPHRGSLAIGASMAYTAPEQAFDGKVDVRSDLFSTGLVLYSMLTGWQRDSLDEMIPPLTPAEIADPDLLQVLRRALAFDPSERFESAREFLAALSGNAGAASEEPTARPPFRYLSGFTEADRWRFHGRALATAQLTDLVLYNQLVVLTGPDGAGKTSLTRAGLIPRLRDLRCHTVYVRCGADPVADAASGLVMGERDLLHAIKAWRSTGGGRVVVLFDELGALPPEARGEGSEALFDAVAACCREAGEDITFLFVVRQDLLSLLKPLRQRLADAAPVMRLGPLTARAAREALVRPLEVRDITIEDAGLVSLVEALQAQAPMVYGAEGDVVHPPDVQLLGSLLHDALDEGFTGTVSAAACQEVLPVEAMIPRWVERCLERAAVATGLGDALHNLMSAMTGDEGRAQPRNEAELGDIDERLCRE
ncbi:MAG: serine/threonine-protein kinase, partial [Myxococcota bacterium]|nr:serine/threonine-protein kinase [Myxococcota bacterium]